MCKALESSILTGCKLGLDGMRLQGMDECQWLIPYGHELQMADAETALMSP